MTGRIRALAKAARARTPERVSVAVRRIVLLWGQVTAGGRMEPSFIVAGGQRCGTTTLFRLLEEHPNLVRPTLVKGTSYFDDDHSKGRRWYRAHFPLSAVGRLKVGKGNVCWTFEFNGYALLHPYGAERIASEVPGARIVMLVRDPVERAYSAHRHELERGFEDLPFEQAIRAEEHRLAGERERLADEPGYRSAALRHHAYLTRGRYVEQIRSLLSVVDRDRLYIIDADEFFANPTVEFERLQDWLGLPRWTPSEVGRTNERPREEMDPELRAELSRYFEPYDRDLATVMGSAPSWTRSSES